MSKENMQSLGNEAFLIEDLTLSETETENIKGGPSDYLLELDGVKGESKIIRPTTTTATYDLKAAKK
jgi:hypothetical protein